MVYYNKQKRRRFVNWFTLIAVALLVSIPLFHNLGLQPVRLWDEARRAFNTLDMMDGGSWIVTHFRGEPDMWGTKPPFLIWFQALSMSVFGVNAFALRFPSAFAALFTAIAMLYFSTRFMNNRWYGALAAIILVTSSGYLSRHIARTGDFDSLLTLFMFLYAMYFYKVIHIDRAIKRKKSIWLMMLFFTLAVFTKGIAAFLFLPGLTIYLFINRGYKKLLYNPHFYFALAGSVLLIAAFYLGREWLNPGYLKAVWQNELGGRYLVALEGNQEPWYFYIVGLVKRRFAYWCFFILPAILGAFYFRERKIIRFLSFGGLLIATYLVIISFSKTKLMWYDAPLFPLLSIFGAIGVMYILYLLQYLPQYLFKVGYRSHVTGLFLSAIALFFLLHHPVKETLIRIKQDDMEPWHKEWYAFGHLVQSKSFEPHKLEGFCFLQKGYQPQNWFYQEQLNRTYGISLPNCSIDEMAIGDKVIVVQKDMKVKLRSYYVLETINSYPPLEMYQLVDKR